MTHSDLRAFPETSRALIVPQQGNNFGICSKWSAASNLERGQPQKGRKDRMKKFAPDFLLGAATAAHQVEGDNIHSDCWTMEHQAHSIYAQPSQDAVDHYHRYEEDIALLAGAGLNAYRFSIEWARVEPKEGQFDEDEVEHYRRVIACCRSRGVEPVVTLHHFSSPAWLMGKGGWEAESTVEDFARYARFVMERLGGQVNWVCTINEANIGLQIAAIARQFIRQMHTGADNPLQLGVDPLELEEDQSRAVMENLRDFGVALPQPFVSARTPQGDRLIIRAHQAARDAIREVAPHVKVGLTLSLHDIQAAPGGEDLAERDWAEEFSHYLPALEEDDFLGVQNYTRTIIGPEGPLPAPRDAELTQMGYEFYPQGLESVLRRVAKEFHGDLLVTENGVATDDDLRREAYIDTATDGVVNCIRDGLPVKGYFYWSLLDNFEWQKGFDMTFGLIAVDRTGGQVRRPKASLEFLGGLRQRETARQPACV